MLLWILPVWELDMSIRLSYLRAYVDPPWFPPTPGPKRKRAPAPYKRSRVIGNRTVTLTRNKSEGGMVKLRFNRDTKPSHVADFCDIAEGERIFLEVCQYARLLQSPSLNNK